MKYTGNPETNCRKILSGSPTKERYQIDLEERKIMAFTKDYAAIEK